MATTKAWVPALRVNSIQGGFLSGKSEKRPLWGTTDPIRGLRSSQNTGLGSKFFESLTAWRTRSRAGRRPKYNTSAAFLNDQGQFLRHPLDANLLCFIHLCS